MLSKWNEVVFYSTNIYRIKQILYKFPVCFTPIDIPIIKNIMYSGLILKKMYYHYFLGGYGYRMPYFTGGLHGKLQIFAGPCADINQHQAPRPFDKKV